MLSQHLPFAILGIASYGLARKMSSNQPVGVFVLSSVSKQRHTINKHKHSNYLAFASFKGILGKEESLGLSPWTMACE